MPSTVSASPAEPARSRARLVVWAHVVVGLLALLWYRDAAQAFLRHALDGIAGLGPWGPVIFVLVYIAATVLFLPGSILTLGAGQGGRTPAQWALYVVGLLATVTVTVYVTRLARAALAKRITT